MTRVRAHLCAIATTAGAAWLSIALFRTLLPGDDQGVFKRTQADALIGAAVLWTIALLLASKPLRRGVAVSAVSLLIAIAAAELVLQWKFRLYHSSVLTLDDMCLYRLRPESQKYFERTARNGGDRILVSINSDGFRGPELAKEPGLRVAVFGDSFIAAEFSELENTFVQELAAELSAELQTAVEAVNGGVAGYGLDQVHARLESDLALLEPDLLVVGICSENDYGDLLRNKLYRLGDRDLPAPNRFEIGEPLRAKFARSRWPIVPRIAFDRLERAMNLVNQGPPVSMERQQLGTLDLCGREYHRFARDGDDVVRNLFWDHPDEDVRLRPSSESARYKVRYMAAMLSAIQRKADAAAVPLLFVVIPAAADVGDQFDGYTVNEDRYPEYARTNLTAPIERICEQRSLQCMNLFGAFHSGNADELFFHGSDVHWNDAGQALAAQLVAERILSSGLLP